MNPDLGQYGLNEYEVVRLIRGSTYQRVGNDQVFHRNEDVEVDGDTALSLLRARVDGHMLFVLTRWLPEQPHHKENRE